PKQGRAPERVRGPFLQGGALSTQGRGADGLVQMRQGLTDYQATGTMLDLPWYLGALAEAYGSTNRIDAGLDTIKIWQRTPPVKVWVNAILTRSLRACSPQDKCRLP